MERMVHGGTDSGKENSHHQDVVLTERMLDEEYGVPTDIVEVMAWPLAILFVCKAAGRGGGD